MDDNSASPFPCSMHLDERSISGIRPTTRPRLSLRCEPTVYSTSTCGWWMAEFGVSAAAVMGLGAWKRRIGRRPHCGEADRGVGGW
eukprot:scaffold16329_cov121-Isochrysis_galbana.AAC.14